MAKEVKEGVWMTLQDYDNCPGIKCFWLKRLSCMVGNGCCGSQQDVTHIKGGG